MIYVIATIDLQAGARDEFLRIFRENVPLVQQEDGCLEYVPTVDVRTDLAVQSAPRDRVVVVVEKWRDVDALKAHLEAPHMKTFREKVKDLVTGVSLQIVEPVSA